MTTPKSDAVDLARTARFRGITVVDLRATGWHHGKASSALSALHQDGTLVRLSERRDRSRIYVLPEFAAGRAQEAYAPRKGETRLAMRPDAREAAREAKDRLLGSFLDDGFGEAEEEQWIDDLLAALDAL